MDELRTGYARPIDCTEGRTLEEPNSFLIITYIAERALVKKLASENNLKTICT